MFKKISLNCSQGYQMQSPSQGGYTIPSPTGNPHQQSQQQQMLLMQPPQQSPQMPPQMSPQLGGGGVGSNANAGGNMTTFVGRSPQGPHGSTENTSEDSDDNGIPVSIIFLHRIYFGINYSS